MNFFIMGLMVLSFSSVQAGEGELWQGSQISSSFQGNYNTSLKALKLDMKKAKHQIADYLKTTLNCKNVRLCLKDVRRPGSLTNGRFSGNLSGVCTDNLDFLDFELYPAVKHGDRTKVVIRYAKAQQIKEKRILISHNSPKELRKSKDSDPRCY